MNELPCITKRVDKTPAGYVVYVDAACSRPRSAVWADFTHDLALSRWWGPVLRRSANTVVVMDPETQRELEAVVLHCLRPDRIDLRLTAGDSCGSEIRIRMARLDANATAVSIEHRELRTAQMADRTAQRWESALGRLRDAVEDTATV